VSFEMAAVQVLRVFAFFVLITFPCLDSLPIADEGDDDVNGRSRLEYGDKFQGDIVLTPSQEIMLSRKIPKTGLLSLTSRWPKNNAGQVIVPYAFNFTAGFSKIKFN
jgi:hypothetical protein